MTKLNLAVNNHVQNDPDEVHGSSKKPAQAVSLMMDKASMTIDVHEKEDQIGVRDLIRAWTKAEEFPEMGWKRGPVGGYRLAAKIYFPDAKSGQWSEKHIALFQVDPKSETARFVRVEWNPAKLSAEETNYLFDQLELFLQVPRSTFLDAKITRFDVAVDVSDARPGDFIFELVKPFKRTAIYSKKGVLETLYLKRLKKRRGVMIYDKAVQAKLPDLLTRIEICHDPRHLTVAELAAVENPFNRISVFDVQSADCGLGQLERALLREGAGAIGLKPCLAHFPANRRSELLKAITGSVPEFWKPNELWKPWSQVVEAAFPKVFSPPAALTQPISGFAAPTGPTSGNTVQQTQPSQMM